MLGTYTKGLKRSKDDQYSSPPMVQREGEMNEKFVCIALGRVELFDDVIDMLGEKD